MLYRASKGGTLLFRHTPVAVATSKKPLQLWEAHFLDGARPRPLHPAQRDLAPRAPEAGAFCANTAVRFWRDAPKASTRIAQYQHLE